MYYYGVASSAKTSHQGSLIQSFLCRHLDYWCDTDPLLRSSQPVACGAQSLTLDLDPQPAPCRARFIESDFVLHQISPNSSIHSFAHQKLRVFDKSTAFTYTSYSTPWLCVALCQLFCQHTFVIAASSSRLTTVVMAEEHSAPPDETNTEAEGPKEWNMNDLLAGLNFEWLKWYSPSAEQYPGEMWLIEGTYRPHGDLSNEEPPLFCRWNSRRSNVLGWRG
ncbi:uncharacterized protein M421DRAFT_399969 [Didymella exigua CBS 183.55]|uniref:Uncharacterized protein n=1 Tax=Didymella exigua CBS 183.55 TaxID=1150837 RepID=A0A6A5RIC8_9PLEO|nr:uncharacterized protein M421DRAFT_399969 [Didymella exigua CBS 183.55]KAF1925347.1 hypothetical protein M421DRAFT_399969 [Didymella exigua CBS 183.55]